MNDTDENTWTRRRFVLAGSALALCACSRDEDISPPESPKKPVADAAPPVASRVDDPVIRIQCILLPVLAESETEGTLIDLLRALGKEYRDGELRISLMPTARVMDYVLRGVADAGVPVARVRPDADAESMARIRYSACSTGKVTFVLYSNKAKPLVRRNIDEALSLRPFPYRIEAPPTYDWGFPYENFTSFENALNKISAGRIDALLWAQEEPDAVIRTMGLKNIHREYYDSYDDVFMLPRSPRGDFVDRVLGASIDRLRKNGQLAKLYARIHRPYNPWQP